MKYLSSMLLQHLIRLFLYGTVGAVLVLLIGAVLYLQGRPDLQIWHTEELDEEFTTSSSVHNFTEYLELEDRLFSQLEKQIFMQSGTTQAGFVKRYKRGSLSDPANWQTNWNRSFQLPVDKPKAAVLLLHGMSDSPYSLRVIGQQLHEADAWVLGLRLPGHGTIPSGLVTVQWQDMAAAVQLAITHLKNEVGDIPIYIVGYSNGGALAVHYALETLNNTELPEVSGLVLLSPAIGVAKVAKLAVWQARLGHLLGLDKISWNSIQPEYDPFKYNSFAVNAGDQVYRLTANIQSQLLSLQSSDLLKQLPPILTFQSALDTTVVPSAVVNGLLEHLPENGHELVLFDIHRQLNVEHLMRRDPKAWLDELLNRESLSYGLSVVTSQQADQSSVVVIQRKAKNKSTRQTELDLSWPNDLYSLSHVSLHIPADDPLYGASSSDKDDELNLGGIAWRGELGALHVSAADMLRLRWNPFYPYVSQRILEFTELSESNKL